MNQKCSHNWHSNSKLSSHYNSKLVVSCIKCEEFFFEISISPKLINSEEMTNSALTLFKNFLQELKS